MMMIEHVARAVKYLLQTSPQPLETFPQQRIQILGCPASNAAIKSEGSAVVASPFPKYSRPLSILLLCSNWLPKDQSRAAAVRGCGGRRRVRSFGCAIKLKVILIKPNVWVPFSLLPFPLVLPRVTHFAFGHQPHIQSVIWWVSDSREWRF